MQSRFCPNSLVDIVHRHIVQRPHDKKARLTFHPTQCIIFWNEFLIFKMYSTRIATFNVGSSCSDVQAHQGATQSGIYLIQPPNLYQGPWKIFCDLETDGGYWTVNKN